MIQDKDLLLRQLKEIAGILTRLIGLGLTQANIEQQIYTATGLTDEDYVNFSDKQLEEFIHRKDRNTQLLFLNFWETYFIINSNKQKTKIYFTTRKRYTNLSKMGVAFFQYSMLVECRKNNLLPQC